MFKPLVNNILTSYIFQSTLVLVKYYKSYDFSNTKTTVSTILGLWQE